MVFAFIAPLQAAAPGPEIRVSDLGSLRAAVAQAKPGTRILVAAGDYAGGVYATKINGTANALIVIQAADKLHRPVFTGAFQFEEVSYLEVDDLTFHGVGGNAFGVDDGGVREKPAHHITLRRLQFMDVPGGGSNGIKLAGVDDFLVENCAVTNWGGCAVDMVGCHRGAIEGCHFERGGGVGVQTKGASSEVTIRKSAFADYGGRGINIGGSTGIPYFRPALEHIASGQRYESKNNVVEGCTFKGGDAAIAFAGADGGVARFNTVANPAKWAIRILQETSTPDFVPCRGGRFEDNIVVFRSDHWFEGGVNVGPKTSPTSFRFARNWWYCADVPNRSHPSLPSHEFDGIRDRDPMIGPDMNLKSGSPASRAGAQALPR